MLEDDLDTRFGRHCAYKDAGEDSLEALQAVPKVVRRLLYAPPARYREGFEKVPH